MSRADRNEPRHVKRTVTVHADQIVDGRSLGAAMTPSDLFIEFRRVLDLDDDELLAAFSAAADHLPDADIGRSSALLLGLDDVDEAVALCRSVTRSRLTTWRKRGREMTWPELRCLLYGARFVVMGDPD